MASEMILQKNTTIYNEGQPVKVVGIINSGNILMKNDYFSLSIGKGQVMGLFHLQSGTAITTDITTEDTAINAFRLETTFPDKNILQENFDLQKASLETVRVQMNSLIKFYMQYKEQLKNTYTVYSALVKKYNVLCEKLHITSKITTSDLDIPVQEILNKAPHIVSYYLDLDNFLETHSSLLLEEHKAFVYEIILKASEDATVFQKYIHETATAIISLKNILFNEEYTDYFRYFSELLSRTHPGTEDYDEAKTLVTTLFSCLYQMPFVDKNALQTRMEDQQKKMQSPASTSDVAANTSGNGGIQNIVVDSMNKILAVAEEDDEFVASFTKHLFTYKELADKSSNTPAVSQLRHKLTDDFLRLYTNLALKYVSGKPINDTVKLFLMFGYIDEDLAGQKNAEELCKLLQADITDKNEHIFTFIDWLKAIYDGEREPSRNEFDMDYTDFLRSERAAGRITAMEEKEKLEDAKAKVLYEIQNFFPQANKMTFGHISTYCPFFSSHNVIDLLTKGLLSTTKLVQERENIRRIDYQLFYKEVVYSNPAIGINSEFIHKEIMPDFILMPNYGARGIMWQEVEGKKRATPCRMVLPVFTPENLRTLFLRLCGEYRWEMCKRTQGSHWNDPASNSLTGDYFDYLQFYRKNNDLSADAKEKVKVLLTKARNSIKEAFVLDYIIWVAYESEGSPRLNKIARNILFNHCPFPLETRQKLTANPIYLSVIQKHATKYEQLSHRMNNLFQKISNSGKDVPDELLQELTYIDK